MIHSVVDTNVLVVANGSDNASTTCRLAALGRLNEVTQSRSLLLDSGAEIFAEYQKHCNYSGQPGIGDEFFRWAHEHQGWLRRFDLTPHADRYFQEFPDDPALETFDPADRKFVAVSIAASSASSPVPNEIVNAVDSDYSHHQQALSRAGVAVAELCPTDLKQAS
ncbi:hypothetical protein [Candidatus Poriferisodalis sp.]|uniref:hypothetical protein n=1 Tax=Candidatus Poriferisodalis sp. TaxID=3101277 RepID=UPI003B01F37F